jgi:NADPH:quinone reductase
MKVIEMTGQGGPEVLYVADTVTPKPRPNEVLIRVNAAGMNNADLLQRRGHYPVPPGASPILGLEVSGIIAEVGSDVTDWKPGDAVCALLAGGGYAEYCIAPAGQCLPVPGNIALTEAASLPEAIFTVWANLFEPPLLHPGETLLVQGGTSGIGSMAIQTAIAFGIRVIATAGSKEKCDICLQLGCERALNYKEENWVDQAQEWSEERGIDVIFDMVAGDYFPKHLQLLAPLGRLIHIAYSRGREVTTDIPLIMRKRLTITGSTLRPRSIAEKTALRDSIQKRLWPQVSKGKIRPIVDKIFSFDQVADAHRYMESGQHVGKILLRVN